MPIYRLSYVRRAQQDMRVRRVQLIRLVSLFAITLTLTAIGLVALDPTQDPWPTKLFNALWNATNLVTTLGDFTTFTQAQKTFMMGASFSIMVLGGYAITQTINWLTNPIVAINRENRQMSRNFETLRDHVIVIGYSPLGRLVTNRLMPDQNVVIIEKLDDLANLASEQGLLVVQGDAGVDDEVFTRAGIDHAKALVVTSESPDRKLAITLMAHARNANLRIAVTAEDDSRGLLLRRAGATDIVVADDLIASTLVGHLFTPMPVPHAS
ncbi:MAG: NAD-binding protein [Halothiobacillus sp.]